VPPARRSRVVLPSVNARGADAAPPHALRRQRHATPRHVPRPKKGPSSPSRRVLFFRQRHSGVAAAVRAAARRGAAAAAVASVWEWRPRGRSQRVGAHAGAAAALEKVATPYQQPLEHARRRRRRPQLCQARARRRLGVEGHDHGGGLPRGRGRQGGRHGGRGSGSSSGGGVSGVAIGGRSLRRVRLGRDYCGERVVQVVQKQLLACTSKGQG
jgi:uncharacterized membrane protein YgcG